jgi:hypothetical protein
MIIYASPRPNEYNKEPKPSLGQKMTTIQKGLLSLQPAFRHLAKGS